MTYSPGRSKKLQLQLLSSEDSISKNHKEEVSFLPVFSVSAGLGGDLEVPKVLGVPRVPKVFAADKEISKLCGKCFIFFFA
jgi:hypothetical protein